MKISYELDLNTFEAWSGAVDTLDRIREEGKTEALETILEDLYPDGMDETALNDLLWFEPDTVFEWLGIKTDEELEAEEEKTRELLAEAGKAETFDEFCDCFAGCKHCPFEDISGECEDLWEKWKAETDLMALEMKKARDEDVGHV